MRKIKQLIIMLLTISIMMTAIPAAFATEVPTTPLRRSTVSYDGMVRVLLSSMNYPNTLDITLKGPYLADGVQDIELPSGASVSVTMNTSTGSITMKYNGASYDMGKTLSLRRRSTSGTSGFMIAQARKSSNIYPGDLNLSARTSNGAWRLHPVAHVYIEYYLYGVVPYEMGNSSHIEALKAQAIAARTYTVRKMSGSGSLYDVTDTTTDQVYNGTPSGADRCKQAVDETKGICLMVGSRFAATYYTTSNGGQTESIQNAWGSKGYTEAIVKDDPFDLSSSATTRTAVIYKNNSNGSQNAEFKKLLNNKVSASLGMTAQVTSIDAMRLHDPKYDEPSKLYTKLDVTVKADVNGTSYTRTVTFDIFDELEGMFSMSINSGTNELWYVDESNDRFTLTARRHGHGIGMSHRGAQRMGVLGYTHDQILGFYYDGTYRMQHTFTHTVLASVGNETITTTEKPADITPNNEKTAVVQLEDPTSTVNMRASASTNASVLKKLQHNAQVIVLSEEDGWYRVRFDGAEGYVMKEFLVVSESGDSSGSGQPESLPVIGQAYVSTPSGSLNLRNDASSDSMVLAQIPRMAKIPVHTSANGWSQVTYLTQTGWVMTKYLTMIPDESAGGDAEEYARVTTVSGSLNLRADANKNAKILAEIPEGTMIPVYEKTTNWTRTSYAGHNGWVMNAFLTFSGNDEGSDGDTPSATTTATVTGGSLNLRASKSTSATIFLQIPTNTVVPVLEKDGDWTRTTYGGHTGWVMSKYLKANTAGESGGEQAPETQPDTPSATKTAVVTGGGLNLRASKSTTARILVQIPDKTKLTLLETGSTWSKTTYAGKTGWVMTKYLTITDDEPDDTPPADQPTVTPPSDSGSTPSAQTTVVIGGKLNLRSGESSSAGILLRIPDNATVTVLNRGATWSRVQYGGLTGYVMTKYLSFTTSGTAGTAKVTTASGSLNMREDARSGARILLQIPQNAYVTLHSKQGDWCLVSYRGTTGYVMTKFLTIGDAPEGETPDAPQPPTGSTQPEQPDSNGTADSGNSLATSKTAYVKASGTLNMRSAANRSSSIKAILHNGATVAIDSYGSVWTKISIAGLTGYVQTQYLTVSEPAVPAYSSRYVVTSSGSLNMRMEASASSNIVLTIPRHAEVKLMQSGSTWSRVVWQGVIGYVQSSYLSSTNPAPSGQPATPPSGSGAAPQPEQNGSAGLPDENEPLSPVYDSTLRPTEGLVLGRPLSSAIVVRAWCSDDADAVGTLNPEAAATVLEVGNTWCKVQLDANTVGYCRGDGLILFAGR